MPAKLKTLLDSKRLNLLLFSEFEINEIVKVFNYFEHNRFKMPTTIILITNIQTLKENNVSFVRLSERLYKISLLGRDSSSLKSHLYRFGLINGLKKYKNKNKACAFNYDRTVENYGQEYVDNLLSRKGQSFENYVKWYGEAEAKIRWKEYCDRRHNTYQEHKKQGKYKNRGTLLWFIKLYGEVDGKRLYEEKIESLKYAVSRQCFIDLYGEELGTELCREFKTHTSLEAMLKKHGNVKGLIKYEEFLAKVCIPLIEKYIKKYGKENAQEMYNQNVFRGTKEDYIKKYGEQEGSRLYDDKIFKLANSCKSSKSNSNVSRSLFEKLKLIIPDLVDFGKNEKTIILEKDLQRKYNRKFFRIDCLYKKKIIEFNGDVFHGNPAIFTADEKPNPFHKNMTAKEMWEIDQNRYNALTELGYEILVIWERDYNVDGLSVIRKCLKFLDGIII